MVFEEGTTDTLIQFATKTVILSFMGNTEEIKTTKDELMKVK